MKTIAYILIIFFLTIGCFGKKPTLETGHEGKNMPSINLLLLDSTTHTNTKNISTNNPIVLVYFSPFCPYCKILTKEIINDIESLKEIEFIFLSDYPLSSLKGYNIDHHFKNYSNITIAYDYQKYFNQYYKSPGAPCIAIYGKDKKLKQVLIGAVSTNLIKDIAFE